MKCLVTGATGMVGSNLTYHLESEGHEVIGIGTDNEQELTDFKGKLIKKNFYEVDWEKDIGQIDALFHQAAIVGMLTRSGEVEDSRDKFMFVNVESSIKLFEKAIENGCKKIVYASSTSVYGDEPAPYIEGKSEKPNSFYGESKLELDRKAMELANKHEDVTIVGLRYCNIYGPRENHKGRSANYIYQLAQQMKKGKAILFENGQHKRDEIYIKDIVRANLLATNPKESCVVNCGGGKGIEFNEIVKILNEVMGTNREIEYIKNPYEEFFQDHTECDLTKSKEMIRFEPKYDIRRGLKDYYESGWLIKDPIGSNV